MRKYLLVFIIFIILTFLSGCNNNQGTNNNQETNNNQGTNKLISNSNSIVITKHLNNVPNSPTDITININEEEIVNHIVDNFNSLEIEEMYYIKPHGIMYTLEFYNDSNEVKQIEVISSIYLAISGSMSPYCIKKGELDLDYIEKLFNDPNYDIKNLYAKSPMFATQSSYGNKKFDVIFDEAVEQSEKYIIDIDDIKCDSLQVLFNTNLSDQYLKDNYKALLFIREEPIYCDALEDITYSELFIERHIVYASIHYNSNAVGGEAFSYYEDLILIPNEWVEEIASSKIRFNLENHFYLGRNMIMSYAKMQEFKAAYRKQILDKLFDDCMYREIYMLDVYGEYNDCLVSTVTYDGYAHFDVDWTLTETFGDVTITYSGYYPIWVCYNSKLYTLTEAYNNGYLTIDDIRVIAEKAKY